jgi:hypothetical protein
MNGRQANQVDFVAPLKKWRLAANSLLVPAAVDLACCACTFVRAMSVACAQLPRNTTVTRPHVLLRVGS